MRLANILVVVVGAALGFTTVSAPAELAVPRAMNAESPQKHENMKLAGLFDSLFGGSQEDPRANLPPEPKADDDPSPLSRKESASKNGGAYRTVCVRLCDGFYFPISFATTRGKFRDDANRCERLCPAGSRLFVHRNPGEVADAMVDLNGEAYAKLPNAFRFQTSYVADCTCRGNPWDAASLARHQAYAAVQPPAATLATNDRPASGEPRRRNRKTYGYRAE